jgi:hypothetical protein
VNKLTKAQKFASDMSDQLIAKIAVNSLLNTPDQNLDPAILFTAERPGKTRISVINFSGLQADTSRQDFTNNCKWRSLRSFGDILVRRRAYMCLTKRRILLLRWLTAVR